MKAALVLLLLALAGCVARVPTDRSRPLAQGALRCIEIGQVVARRVDPGQLIIRLSNGSSYRNDLQGTCPALNRATGSEILQTASDGGDLCRGDPVRIFDPAVVGPGGSSDVLRCRAGDFTPVAGG